MPELKTEKDSNIKFSIIIPTYNRADLIMETLDSVFQQTYTNFEIIVVDDGSTDNTEEIIKDFQSNKLHYFKKENAERGAARNYGWAKAQGHFVSFLDSDDKLYPNHLQEAFTILNMKKYSCYAQAYEIRMAKNNKLIRTPYVSKTDQINNQIINHNFLSCFGVFLRREIIEEIKFEEDRNFAGSEDWLLWLQLAARFPFYFNNKITGAMLEHEERSVLSFKEESLSYRSCFIKTALEKDHLFVEKYGKRIIQRIYAHMLTYTSLHLAINKKRIKSIQYFVKACKADYKEIFTRRSFGILKNIIFS